MKLIKQLIEKLYFKCFPDRKDYISPFEPVPVQITHTTVTPVKINAICYIPKRFVDNTQIKTKLVEIMIPELIKHVQIVEVQECDFDELQYWGMIEVLPNEKENI